jgi:hypothetical protein
MKDTEKTRTHFTFRIDTWSKPNGQSIVEHIAGVEDYQIALATFRACERCLTHRSRCDRARE